MAQHLHEFWIHDEGQDLAEYSLLIVFVTIAIAVVFGFGRSAIEGIWHTNNSNIVAANEVANGR